MNGINLVFQDIDDDLNRGRLFLNYFPPRFFYENLWIWFGRIAVSRPEGTFGDVVQCYSDKAVGLVNSGGQAANRPPQSLYMHVNLPVEKEIFMTY